MTKQNAIHRCVVVCEQQGKCLLKENQRRRNGGKVIRTSKTRKWWKQYEKECLERWVKECLERWVKECLERWVKECLERWEKEQNEGKNFN